MNYPLYIDTTEDFSCTIKIEGADAKEASARLVIETSKYSLMFEGEIKDEQVTIPLTRLKSILDEGDMGKMKLEVVADDTLLIPWEATYDAQLSKKASIEEPTNLSTNNVPKVTVQVNGKDSRDIVTEFYIILDNNGITIDNIVDKQKELITLTNTFIADNDNLDIDRTEFIGEILNKLNN